MPTPPPDDEPARTPHYDTSVMLHTPWFDLLHRVPGKGGAPYYALKPKDYASVLAVTAADEVLLVRQFRPALEQWTWEFPSGTIEDNEDPDAAMARELREETGYRPVRLQRLGILQPDSGRLANRLYAYFAEVEPDPQRLSPDPEEWSLRSTVISRQQFLQRQAADPLFMAQALHLAVLHVAALRGVYDILRP